MAAAEYLLELILTNLAALHKVNNRSSLCKPT
jgi:hypothetical protein